MKAKLVRVGPYGVKTDQHGDVWVGNGKGKYAAIKGELQELFHVGDTVEIETKQNGEYLNLVSMAVTEKALENTTSTTNNGKYSYSKSDKYPSETANKDALLVAVQVLGPSENFKGDEVEYLSRLKGIAENLAKFILSNNPRMEAGAK